MAPSLKLRPTSMRALVPSVISVLPPPMSMTTAAALADADGVRGGQMNQPGFFGARDDPDAQADLAPGLGDEVSAIVGFPDRARGRGDDLVDAVRLGQPAKFRQRLHRRRRCWPAESRDSSACRRPARIMSFSLIDDFEREIRPDPADDHVQGVAADVDGRNSHVLR